LKARLVLLLSLALLLGAGLRLDDLGGPSLWMDEGFTWMVASGPLSELPERVTLFDKHPPLHYAVARAALLVGGHSELWLRLPSALAGVLTIPVVFLLARQVGVSGAGAALLMAVGAMHVLVTRDGRGYGLATLCLALTFWLWARLLQRLRPPEVAGWFLAGVAALYTHYLAIVVLAWQWLLLVCGRPRQERARWLGIPALGLLVFSPWIPTMLRQAATPSPGHPPPAWSALLEVLYAQSVGFTLNFTPWRVPGLPSGLQNHAAWYTVVLIGTLALAFSWARGPLARRLLGVFVGTVVSLVVVSRLTGAGLYESKYTVLVSPAFWVLVACGATHLGRRFGRSAGLALLGFFLLLNLASSLNAVLLEEWHRQDLRGAAAYLARHARPGDRLLVVSGWALPALDFYAHQLPAMRVQPLGPRQVAAFGSDFQAGQRVWLLRASASLFDPRDRVLTRLRRTCPPPVHSWTAWRRNPDLVVDLKCFETPGTSQPGG